MALSSSPPCGSGMHSIRRIQSPSGHAGSRFKPPPPAPAPALPPPSLLTATVLLPSSADCQARPALRRGGAVGEVHRGRLVRRRRALALVAVRGRRLQRVADDPVGLVEGAARHEAHVRGDAEFFETTVEERADASEPERLNVFYGYGKGTVRERRKKT